MQSSENIFKFIHLNKNKYYEVLIWKANPKRLFFTHYYIKYMYIVILLYKKKHPLSLLASERRTEVFNCYKFDECIISPFHFYVKLFL